MKQLLMGESDCQNWFKDCEDAERREAINTLFFSVIEGSEVASDALDLPVAETRRILAATSAQFFREIGFLVPGKPASLFCFCKRSQGSWWEFPRGNRGLVFFFSLHGQTLNLSCDPPII